MGDRIWVTDAQVFLVSLVFAIATFCKFDIFQIKSSFLKITREGKWATAAGLSASKLVYWREAISQPFALLRSRCKFRLPVTDPWKIISWNKSF